MRLDEWVRFGRGAATIGRIMPFRFAPISVIHVARSASRKRTWPADNETAVTGGERTSAGPLVDALTAAADG